MNIYYQICLQVKTSRRISTGDQTKKGLFIDTFSGLCPDTLLLTKQQFGCISCPPYLQSMLCLGMCFIMALSPPSPHPPLVLTEQRVTEQRRCHIVARSSTWAQRQNKLDTRATYRYLRFSRSSNAPLGILRIWLLLRSLRGKENRGTFGICNIDRELILASKWSRKNLDPGKGSHRVIYKCLH